MLQFTVYYKNILCKLEHFSYDGKGSLAKINIALMLGLGHSRLLIVHFCTNKCSNFSIIIRISLAN